MNSIAAPAKNLLSLWQEDIEQQLLPNVIFPLDSAASVAGGSEMVPAFQVLPLMACHFASPANPSVTNVHSILISKKLHFDLWKECDLEIQQRSSSSSSDSTADAASEANTYMPLDGWGMKRPLLQRITQYNYECSQLLPLYKYRSIEESDAAVYHTLQYMFFHVKNGIYVKIKNGKVAAFTPFHNREPAFQNNWAYVPSSRPLRIGKKTIHSLAHASSESVQKMASAVRHYYERKQEEWGALYSDEGYSADPRTWWANAGIVDNVQSVEGWSAARNAEILDMLQQTCQSILVPDCDFFINKRDFPHLHYDLASQRVKEPYPFLFVDPGESESACIASSSPCLVTHASMDYSASSRFAPIFSLASSSAGNFADLLLPLPDDWKLATGQDEDLNAIRRSGRSSLWTWKEKKNQLIWRGSATGPGVTPETNQRLALVKLAQEFPKLLNCQLTGLNLRDRVNFQTGELEYLRLETAVDVCKSTKEKTVSDFAKLKKRHFMSFPDQCEYKYMIYVQGHSAAFRYGKMMFSNSLILKVESTVLADKLWFFDALHGYSPLGNENDGEDWKFCDHLIVKKDLSDLVSLLEWCEMHDDICQTIARNAYTLALQLFTKDTIMQYIHNACIQIHLNRTHYITEFLPVVIPEPSPASADLPEPQLDSSCDPAASSLLLVPMETEDEDEVRL